MFFDSSERTALIKLPKLFVKVTNEVVEELELKNKGIRIKWFDKETTLEAERG